MIECCTCDGAGCGECGWVGNWELTICPKEFVKDIADDINLMALAIGGFWPVLGGSLDQSAWFVAATNALAANQNKIDEERSKDANPY